MGLLEKIRTLVEEACPGYSFQFETEKMMNVNADDVLFPCVFFEEYSSDGKYISRYGWRKQALVELSFMRLTVMQNTAEEREAIREMIEEEAVIPFMDAFNACGEFVPVAEFTCYAQPPRFDANEVSV
ncbi:MAG: hypothetical protein LUE27_02660, partial [Clostridia bacterium]|nr:hypothetical protein [Clostridia bacterium]